MSRTVAAITGASSGIGAEFARRLAPGHDLLLIARRKDRLESLAAELSRSYGTHVEVLPADLTIEGDVTAVAKHIREEPRLSLLVNNAGFGVSGWFWEASLESQEQMHRLHVLATVALTHAALRNMIPKDFGAVINVASVAAFVRSPGTTSYAATKSWMTVFTEGLYLELKGIRSNVVVQALCPGFTRTDFQKTMNARPEQLPGEALWMSAEQVVDRSLDGLRNKKLFVIPGWRYRLFAALFSKLPAAWRLNLESIGTRSRLKHLSSPEASKRLDSTP